MVILGVDLGARNIGMSEFLPLPSGVPRCYAVHMTTTQTQEARGWCEDCFSDYPDDATDDEVWACVARQYDGGIAAFLADVQ